MTDSSPSPRPASSRQRKKSPPPVARDPERTRAGLLDAAIIEFADHGYGGARIQGIAERAGTNIRMIYHYFGNKDEIYLAVLEEVLAALRHDELQHDTEVEDPVQGLLDVFDQIDRHFATHPRLRQILAFENLNQARHLVRSERIREMAWPVLQRVRRLLAQGVKAGVVRSGIEPLHLYVAMASLAYYGRSHAYTLSRMFRQDMLKPSWQRAHREQTRQMLLAFLAPSSF